MKSLITIVFLTFFINSYFIQKSYSNEIKIYSERQPFLIEPLIDEYQKKNDIKIEWIFSKKGLVQKAILEKDNPLADIFLSSDISRLIDIDQAGAAHSFHSDTITSNVPLKNRTDKWVGLTNRARIIYAHNSIVDQIKNYEDLVLPQWKGLICTRSGFHPYNVSLFAMLLEKNGYAWLEDYLIKLKENLARRPQGNDRDQVKAIDAGVCKASLGNHYYFFKMLKDETQKKWLKNVTPIFPNQNNYGTHVNISGVALLDNNNKNAVDFISFLTSEKAQFIYAKENYEFPTNPNVNISEDVFAFSGNVKFDDTGLFSLANNRKDVLNILNKINFDN